MTPIPDVNWASIVAFVRQHSHDLRNELNGLDLEAALIADIVTDPEALEGVARMRAGIRKVAADLRTLSARVAEPHPNPVRMTAMDLFVIWQDQLASLSEGPDVKWTSELGAEFLNVDPSGVGMAFRELLANAKYFGSGAIVHASAKASGGEVAFRLREPKQASVDTAGWGRSPFVSTRRGGQGLGLCYAARAIEASGGKISWAFDGRASELVTTIAFPIDETR